MTNIAETVRNYILTSFLNHAEAAEPAGHSQALLRDDDDLLTILDSLQILRMLMDLETEFAIKVDNSELSPENLGSIEKLAAFIARKQQAAACSN
jgi:acyl carrier protein